jgi:hypothetical protein
MTKLNKASEQALNELLNDVNILSYNHINHDFLQLNRMPILINTVN